MNDPAKSRFVAMQLARMVGVFMVLLGVMLQAGRIEALRGVPPWIGYVLIVIGLADTFVMPMVLAKRWRTPPE